jgi:hypothetical protein
MSVQSFVQHLQGLQAGTPEFVEAQEAVESPEKLVAYAESKGFQIDKDEATGVIKAGHEIAEHASTGLSEEELKTVVGGNVQSSLVMGGVVAGYGATIGAIVGGPLGAAVGGVGGGLIGGVVGLFGGGTSKSGRAKVR